MPFWYSLQLVTASRLTSHVNLKTILTIVDERRKIYMNWIVVAGLGGLGFAFPPVWIALGLYLVWALFLKRVMRGGIIKKDISELIRSGSKSGYIGVHYHEAEAYAVQFGGRKTNSGSQMSLVINGAPRSVKFSQPSDDAAKYKTYISVE
jgi:hypothetical protein